MCPGEQKPADEGDGITRPGATPLAQITEDQDISS